MKINTKNTVLCLLAASFLSACIGDRKQVDVEELGDSSFVNENHSPLFRLCAYLSWIISSIAFALAFVAHSMIL